jgi:hypothetical protein
MLECVISGSRSDPWTLPRMQPQFSHLLPLNQNNLNRRGPLWNGKIYDEPPRNSMGKLHTNLNWKKVKILSTFRCWFPLIPFISKPHLLTNGDVYNPEKLVPLGTQDTWRTQTKQHRKLKRSATAKCWTKLIANMHRKHNTTRALEQTTGPTRNKNCIWGHVCWRIGTKWAIFIGVLPIHAPYQVMFHLAKRFQRRRFFRNRPNKNKNYQWRPYF